MKTKLILYVGVVALLFTSCTATHKTMRVPNMRVELEMGDFDLSDQVTAEATSTRIFGIDWQRLFDIKTGQVQGGSSLLIDLANIPVMGTYIYNTTYNFALYELMTENPDYDVVVYPQYKSVSRKPILGLGFIMTEETVTVKSRLGKLKAE